MNTNPPTVEIGATWYIVVGVLVCLYLLIYFRHKIQLKLNGASPTETKVERLYQDLDSKVIKITHFENEYLVLKDKTGMLLLDKTIKEKGNDDV
ncbi:MAG: hypothetical protein HWE27_17805 [Gammaproteobacteria bacterium]|nr:hypothetical protein [Gammaproteobacteria bacterium]